MTPVGNAAPPRPSSCESFSSPITASGAELARPPQLLEAAGRDVRVERRRVDAGADPAQQAQRRVARLRQRRPGLGQLQLARLDARDRAVGGGRALAEAEARARVLARADPRALERARQIGADVRHVGRALFEREQRVEARDAVGIGGRHREPPRRVAERALAHPADPQLRRTERGEEEMPSCPVGACDPVARARFLADDRVDRLPLGVGRHGVEEVEVH